MMYESIQRLIETTSFEPDVILMAFSNFVLLWEVCHAVIYGVVIYLTLRLLHWLWMRVKNRKKD